MKKHKVVFVAYLQFIFIWVISSSSEVNCNRQIAFTGFEQVGSKSDIFIADLCSHDVHQITTGGTSSNPIWSPDAAKIAFQQRENGQDHVYVMDPNNPTKADVTEGFYAAYYPQWSPKNDYISFLGRSTANDPAQLYLVKPDGSDLRLLVESEGNVTYSAWSIDGKRIAFISHAAKLSHYLMIVNVDGTNFTKISVEQKIDDFLSWSPDGTTIAYVLNGHINLLDCIYLLSNDIVKGSFPNWSPDGQKIIFVADSQLYVINPYDREQYKLTQEGYNYSPTWSPDGSQIAFLSYQGNNPKNTDLLQIYTMDSSGLNQTKLTSLDKNLRQEHPVWKPLEDITLFFIPAPPPKATG